MNNFLKNGYKIYLNITKICKNSAKKNRLLSVKKLNSLSKSSAHSDITALKPDYSDSYATLHI